MYGYSKGTEEGQILAIWRTLFTENGCQRSSISIKQDGNGLTRSSFDKMACMDQNLRFRGKACAWK